MKSLITIFTVCLFTIPAFCQGDQSVAAFMKTASEVSSLDSLTQDDAIQLLLYRNAIDSVANRPYQSKAEEFVFRKLNMLIQAAKNKPWFNDFLTSTTIQETRHFIILEELGSASRGEYEAKTLPEGRSVEVVYDIGMTHGMANELVTDAQKQKQKAVHSYIPMLNLGLVIRFSPRAGSGKPEINTLSWGLGTGATMAQQDTVRTTYIPAKVLIFGGLQNANTFQFEADYLFNTAGGRNMFGWGFLVGSNAIKVGTLFYYKKDFNMISVEVRYNLAFAFRRFRY